MNIKRSSASRGELTKAMSATLREVRLHHDQIAAALAGIQQLMDGQAALGEAFEALEKRMEHSEAIHRDNALERPRLRLKFPTPQLGEDGIWRVWNICTDELEVCDPQPVGSDA